jgi:hypothetical protein
MILRCLRNQTRGTCVNKGLYANHAARSDSGQISEFLYSESEGGILMTIMEQEMMRTLWRLYARQRRAALRQAPGYVAPKLGRPRRRVDVITRPAVIWPVSQSEILRQEAQQQQSA